MRVSQTPNKMDKVNTNDVARLKLVMVWKIIIIPVIITHVTTSSSILLVVFLEDWVDNFFQFSLLLIEIFLFSIIVGGQPIKNIIDGFLNGISILFTQFS